MRKPSKTSLTTQYIVLFGVLLLVANIVLGLLLLRQSSAMVQTLIRKSMLNVSNTAAELIDGDLIGSFTEEDVGTEPYLMVYDQLAAFQANDDIEYIYAARQNGENEYGFTVDPDPVAPGAFGENLVVTDALIQAGKGIAAVDDAPAVDRWGKHYSAYSPIFDSNGKVAGIVGVDFDPIWFNEQAWKNTLFVILFSVLFTAVGASAFLLLNNRVHKRFRELNAELAKLSGDVESLTRELASNAGHVFGGTQEPQTPRPDDFENGAGDEIQSLGRKLQAMHREMEIYLGYMHAQVYTDTLTRVGNTSAYLERQKELEAKILDGSAAFSAVVFDINDLKHVNDRFGHACGDRTIRAAASVIAEVFAINNTFRIGGDEFIAIVEQATDEEMAEKLDQIDSAIENYNRSSPEDEAELSLSKGYASFVRGADHSFRDVFVRADMQMYECKDRYHRRDRSPV